MAQNEIKTNENEIFGGFKQKLLSGNDGDASDTTYDVVSKSLSNPAIDIEKIYILKGKRKTDICRLSFPTDRPCRVQKDDIGLLNADNVIKIKNDPKFYEFSDRFINAFYGNEDDVKFVKNAFDILADHIVSGKVGNDDYPALMTMTIFEKNRNLSFVDGDIKEALDMLGDYTAVCRAIYERDVEPNDGFFYNNLLHDTADKSSTKDVNDLSINLIEKYLMYRDYKMDIEPSGLDVQSYMDKYPKMIGPNEACQVHHDLSGDFDTKSFSSDTRPESDKFLIRVGSEDTAVKYFVLEKGKKPVSIDDYTFDENRYPALHYMYSYYGSNSDMGALYDDVFLKTKTAGSTDRSFVAFDELELETFRYMMSHAQTTENHLGFEDFALNVNDIVNEYVDAYSANSEKYIDSVVYSNMHYLQPMTATGGRSDLFKMGEIAKPYITVNDTTKMLSDMEKNKKLTIVQNCVRSESMLNQNSSKLYELLKLNGIELSGDRRSVANAQSFRHKMLEVDSVKQNQTSIETALDSHDEFVLTYGRMRKTSTPDLPSIDGLVSDYLSGKEIDRDSALEMEFCVQMATMARVYNACTRDQYSKLFDSFQNETEQTTIYTPKSMAEMSYLNGLNRIIHKDIDLNFTSYPDANMSFDDAVKSISKDVNSLLLSSTLNNPDFSLKVFKEDLEELGEKVGRKYDGVSNTHFADLTETVIKTSTNKIKEDIVKARIEKADVGKTKETRQAGK